MILNWFLRFLVVVLFFSVIGVFVYYIFNQPNEISRLARPQPDGFEYLFPATSSPRYLSTRLSLGGVLLVGPLLIGAAWGDGLDLPLAIGVGVGVLSACLTRFGFVRAVSELRVDDLGVTLLARGKTFANLAWDDIGAIERNGRRVDFIPRGALLKFIYARSFSIVAESIGESRIDEISRWLEERGLRGPN